MKITTILKKIWKAIGKVFHKIDEETKKLIPIAVNIVEAIKNFEASSTMDFVEFVVTTAIPGDADDKIIAKVRSITKEWLPKILLELKVVQSITDLTDDNAKLQAILAELKLTSTKGILYKGIAAKFLELMADGKFDFDDACNLVSYYFANKDKEV